jgi:hypothetical protein
LARGFSSPAFVTCRFEDLKTLEPALDARFIPTDALADHFDDGRADLPHVRSAERVLELRREVGAWPSCSYALVAIPVVDTPEVRHLLVARLE